MWYSIILLADEPVSECCALSEQIAHSTVDLKLKEISEFLHGSVMNKTHKIQLLRIWPIEPIASESVPTL